MRDSIKLFEEYDESVFYLWAEAFGDNYDDINYFLKSCKNKTALGYFCDSKLVSMMFLVDCQIYEAKSKYIYAACTLESYKNKGYMSKLLGFSQEKFNSLVLIPANKELVEFYQKRGFTEKIMLNSLTFNENESIREYLLEGCSLNEPFLLRFESIYN